jgi:hypothetical protein
LEDVYFGVFEGAGELLAGWVMGFGGDLVFEELEVGGLVVRFNSL